LNPINESIKDTIIPGLADKMKAKTWDLHKKAERTGIVGDILKRQISLEAYALYVRNLLDIYEALEKTMIKTSSPTSFQPFFDPALFRTKFLRQDLKTLKSALNQSEFSVLDITNQYVENIETAANKNPAALLGHIYVRYLGDLNGGTVLARLLTDALSLRPSMLNFYNFPEIDDLKSYRESYRNKLNQLQLTAGEISCAIASAKDAFKLNITLSIDVKTHQS